MTKRKANKNNKKRKHSRQQSFSWDKRQEILGLLLILTGVLVFIALYTYVPTETPAGVSQGYRIENEMGWAGVYLSHYLYRYTIGYPALILPFLVIIWGLNRLLDKDTYHLKRWSLLAALFALFISVAFAWQDLVSAPEHLNPSFEFSGRLGGMLAGVLIALFGDLGSIIVLIGIILLTVLLSTTVSLAQVLSSIETFLIRTWYKLYQFLQTWWSRQQHKKTEQPRIRKRPPAPETAEKPAMPEQVPEADFPPVYRREDKAPDQPDESFEEDEAENDSDETPDLNDTLTCPEFEDQYEKPPLDLLQQAPENQEGISEEALRMNAGLLVEKLKDFGIRAQVVEINPGPVITLYELSLAPGIRVSRIVSLSDDLAMAMRAKRIRIVAPIPGKSTIGIEVPNPVPEVVYIREILSTTLFQNASSPLTFAIGKDISGEPYVADLQKMPHLLIAGATGSGKSVCLNTIINSFLYKATPATVQFLMIDPKRLELSNYAKLYHHHLSYVEGSRKKVATTAKTAIEMLKSAEMEMERRYDVLAAAGVRSVEEYNQKIYDGIYAPEGDDNPQPLPYLVVIVDELADLMLTSSAARDVEEPIARLAQMARAVGIHLILATQRPSVDVITGVIKANFPARIAFQVAQRNDSRIILDMNGAEQLLGRGDMLFMPPASPEAIRLHNAYIGSEEIETVIEHVRHQPCFEKTPLKAFKEESEDFELMYDSDQRDALFENAAHIVVNSGQGSVSIIQRKLKVGYSRAARIIDQLEAAGIVGPFEGSKAREVLLQPDELQGWFQNSEEI
ncbi:MAG: DNA translocase FtsK 4TM domain-containing protein [candidate division KSB1 bacterium]|nr:DNA translocase FtsK 4TM domain-containing protein [candidate division KSB1 bacterium]